jgi:hypothetical protein
MLRGTKSRLREELWFTLGWNRHRHRISRLGLDRIVVVVVVTVALSVSCHLVTITTAGTRIRHAPNHGVVIGLRRSVPRTRVYTTYVSSVNAWSLSLQLLLIHRLTLLIVDSSYRGILADFASITGYPLACLTTV